MEEIKPLLVTMMVSKKFLNYSSFFKHFQLNYCIPETDDDDEDYIESLFDGFLGDDDGKFSHFEQNNSFF